MIYYSNYSNIYNINLDYFKIKAPFFLHKKLRNNKQGLALYKKQPWEICLPRVYMHFLNYRLYNCISKRRIVPLESPGLNTFNAIYLPLLLPTSKDDIPSFLLT